MRINRKDELEEPSGGELLQFGISTYMIGGEASPDLRQAGRSD